jgi:hypothetical protein
VSLGGRRGDQAREMGFGSGFIGEHGLVEERERERERERGHGAELGSAGGAGVLCGAWRSLGTGSPTW